MTNNQPAINEIIAYIEQQQPSRIEKIREENPDYSDILKAGILLGDSEQPNELKVRAKVCLEGLDTILIQCGHELPKIKSKLLGLKRIQFFGQILSAVGGASVIITLANDLGVGLTYFSGVLSLIGAIITIISEFLNKGIGKSKQIDEVYSELTRFQIDAKNNQRELAFYIDNEFNQDGIKEIINKSNQLCADITLLFSTI